ncbi:MAG: radical SAM protein [Gemmatimonadota bacterium]|nr:radical SAM protein [Gemmatimonadota bacterium]
MELDPARISIGGIEINNSCNLNCIMCETQNSTRPRKIMNPTLFDRIARQLKRSGQNYINMYTFGEVLINPQLEEFLRILRKYELKTRISTNGQILDRRLDLLCRYSDVIHRLRFSIDGATKQVYEKIRRPGKFEKLLDNLELLKKINMGHRYFKEISIVSIVSKDTIDHLAYLFRFYSHYAPMRNIQLSLLNGLALDTSYFLTANILPERYCLQYPCQQIFSENIKVYFDGRVTVCCRDFNGELTYGNLGENEPEELINNEVVKQFRRDHLAKKIPLCRDCYHIEPEVQRLFSLFWQALIYRYERNWQVDRMQAKFDCFFRTFAKNTPCEDNFMTLFA